MKYLIVLCLMLGGCGHFRRPSMPPNRSIESCDMTYFDYPVAPREATPEEKAACETWVRGK